MSTLSPSARERADQYLAQLPDGATTTNAILSKKVKHLTLREASSILSHDERLSKISQYDYRKNKGR